MIILQEATTNEVMVNNSMGCDNDTGCWDCDNCGGSITH